MSNRIWVGRTKRTLVISAERDQFRPHRPDLARVWRRHDIRKYEPHGAFLRQGRMGSARRQAGRHVRPVLVRMRGNAADARIIAQCLDQMPEASDHGGGLPQQWFRRPRRRSCATIWRARIHHFIIFTRASSRRRAKPIAGTEVPEKGELGFSSSAMAALAPIGSRFAPLLHSHGRIRPYGAGLIFRHHHDLRHLRHRDGRMWIDESMSRKLPVLYNARSKTLTFDLAWQAYSTPHLWVEHVSEGDAEGKYHRRTAAIGERSAPSWPARRTMSLRHAGNRGYLKLTPAAGMRRPRLAQC